MKTNIEELDLTVRAYNCLKRHGINFVEQLLDMTENEVKQIRNINLRALDNIILKLKERGLSLKNSI